MDYSGNIGIASFLQNFSKNLLTAYEQHRQQQDEINKANTERTMHAIDTNRIMYQPQNPVPAPTSFTGQPVGLAPQGVGGFFPVSQQPNLPTIGQPAPALPKLQPNTLQQQLEIARILRGGGNLPPGQTTVQPEKPDGTLVESQQGPTGDVTNIYKNLDITPEQKEKNRLAQDKINAEAKRAKDMRTGPQKDIYMAATTLAIRIAAGNIDMKTAEPGVYEEYINDLREAILAGRKNYEAGGSTETLQAGNPKAGTNFQKPVGKPTHKVGDVVTLRNGTKATIKKAYYADNQWKYE